MRLQWLWPSMASHCTVGQTVPRVSCGGDIRPPSAAGPWPLAPGSRPSARWPEWLVCACHTNHPGQLAEVGAPHPVSDNDCHFGDEQCPPPKRVCARTYLLRPGDRGQKVRYGRRYSRQRRLVLHLVQVLQDLVGGRDDAGVGLEAALRDDQVGELLREVDVRHFE
jgi:hypothetical protein